MEQQPIVLGKTKVRENGTKRVTASTGGRIMVEQQHKNRTDINKIVSKINKTRQVPIMSGSPLWGDFSDVGSFHECKNRVLQAEADFLQIPSGIRDRFNQDPEQLTEFLNNPENRSEAEELGLIARVEPEPEGGEIVPPAAGETPETPVTE